MGSRLAECAGWEGRPRERPGELVHTGAGGARGFLGGTGSGTPGVVSCLQVENLRAFSEDRTKLANADQFYLLLLGIPW